MATFESRRQDLVGVGRDCRQFVHGAAPRACQQSSIVKTARVHAGAAKKHLAIAGQHTLEHALNIVITLWRFLAGSRRGDSVGHQKDRHFLLWFFLQQCLRETKRVVDTLGAIRRIVQHK